MGLEIYNWGPASGDGLCRIAGWHGASHGGVGGVFVHMCVHVCGLCLSSGLCPSRYKATNIQSDGLLVLLKRQIMLLTLV